MNHQQIDSYRQISIQQLLKEQLNCPWQNTSNIVFAKARTQPCNPRVLQMTLALFQRDGNKWLKVIERFALIQFKLTFSICIKNVKTYPALLQQICKQGQAEHQSIFQKNIQQALETSLQLSNDDFYFLWGLYLQYLNEWSTHIPHRTIYALQKIQNRLSRQQNIYQIIQEREKIVFIKLLAGVIQFHEQSFMRKLMLRRFWQSIPTVITYLKQQLSTSRLINLLVKMGDQFQASGNDYFPSNNNHLQNNNSNSPNNNNHLPNNNNHLPSNNNHLPSNNNCLLNKYNISQTQLRQQEDIILFLLKTSQVSILQQTYLVNAFRLAKQLAKRYIIDYKSYKSSNIEQLLILQDSLINHILGDDLASLMEQLLVTLSKVIPNFLGQFLKQCCLKLYKNDLDEISTSDIILKFCILSKQIIEHKKVTEQSLDIKQLVDRLVIISDSKSQLIQVKTIKLMYYFKEVLPEQYFISYHEVIFRILRTILTSQIQRQNLVIGQHSFIQTNIQHLQSNIKHHSTNTTTTYTSISYHECIKLLDQQTQIKEKMSLQNRIRKKKFVNERKVSDLVQTNILWLSDKVLQLLSFQGYCQQQQKIYQIFQNMINKYPIIQQRNTVYLLKVLSRQFQSQFTRILSLPQRQRIYKKVLLILSCIDIVLHQVNEDTYFSCQQQLVPIIHLLKQPYVSEIQDQLISFITLLIQKANMVTPQVNNCLIYAKQVLQRRDSSIIILENVVKELCRPTIAKSVKQEWSGLVLFYTGIFSEYVRFVNCNKQTVELYRKDWVRTVHVMQLFLQTYQEQYSASFQLGQILLQMQFQIQQIGISEQTQQLLMTIHHISSKCKLYPHRAICNLQLYKEAYTLLLLELTMADIMIRNFRSRIFDFEESSSLVYPFLDQFINVRRQVKQKHHNALESTPNDRLPLNKINPQSYILSAIQSLFRDKLLDIQQFTELKNKLLDERCLIKNLIFQ